MIECDLLPLPEYSSLPSEKPRYGRYHSSCFWDIKNYGTKKWVVAAYIKVKNSAVFNIMEEEEVFEGCFEYLNKTPPKKKWAKKDPQPKYGVLKPYQNKIIIKGGEKIISTLFTIPKKKDKHFWGKGKSV